MTVNLHEDRMFYAPHIKLVAAFDIFAMAYYIFTSLLTSERGFSKMKCPQDLFSTITVIRLALPVQSVPQYP